MAELSLYRGEKSKIKNFPIKDGQVLIGTISDETAAIYIDTLNKTKDPIRVEIDLTEYIGRIESLETEIELLNRYLQDGLLYSVLQTKDGVNITTNNNEKIIFAEK